MLHVVTLLCVVFTSPLSIFSQKSTCNEVLSACTDKMLIPKRGSDAECSWPTCPDKTTCGTAQKTLEAARKQGNDSLAKYPAGVLLTFADNRKKEPRCAHAQYLIASLWEDVHDRQTEETAFKADAKQAAFVYYDLSAKQKYPPGMYQLARFYHDGIGCPRTDEEKRKTQKAYELYKRAYEADRENHYFESKVACCLMYGWGKPQDLEQASRMLRCILAKTMFDDLKILLRELLAEIKEMLAA